MESSHSELHKHKSLTQRSWGSGGGGTVSPPGGPGLSPGGGQGGEAPGKLCVFSSKNGLDWIILSQLLALIL